MGEMGEGGIDEWKGCSGVVVFKREYLHVKEVKRKEQG